MAIESHAFKIEDAKKYGVDAAIILNNLHHWLTVNKANMRNIHDGYVWTYNTSTAYSEMFPYWSANKIQKLLKKLENDGVIISGVFNENRYDRTKWYSMPEYRIQPNGGIESASRMNELSASADSSLSNINTDINTDIKTIDTQTSLNDVFFVDQLSKEDFEYCHEAMGVLSYYKDKGHNIYTGSMSISDWQDCENQMRSVDFDSVMYFKQIEPRFKSIKKKSGASLKDLLFVDSIVIDFEQFYSKIGD